MKKQVLFFVVAAFFAGTMAFGQALPGSLTRGTNCVSNALAPVAGNAYTYQAAGDPTGGTFLFWATKDPNFISTTGALPPVTVNNLATRLTTTTQLTATSANYAVAGAADVVSITWSDATLAGTTLAAPTFVAVYYTAPASGCADNFNAWEIKPINAFIVDIRNIHDATKVIQPYDNLTLDQCVDQVRGATYAGGTISYNFGTDTLYYEVVAANFTVSWTPTFTLTGLDAVEVPDIKWTYAKPATWGAGTVWSAPGVVLTNETNTSQGVSIYVRVVVTHNNYEGLADRPITLTVDGVNSVLPTPQWDIENNNLSNVGPLCNPGALNDKMDIALQTLKKRPTLTPVTPTPFIPGNQKN